MSDSQRLEHFIKAYDGPPVRLMEVCGTHTHSIFQYGIRGLLPPNITLVSGPGCPVCVTPAGFIDRAAELALQGGWTLCTFGDMMRVPGEKGNLLDAKASGGDVRVMYSPMDALRWAAREPERTFAVAAVGFETTIPAYALLLERLAAENVDNVRLLTALKAMPPALNWICENDPAVDGLIGPGHVSVITGSDAFAPLCACYRIPLAVGGFEYEQILAAIADLLSQLKSGLCQAHNLYPEAVTKQGNLRAQALMDRYFTLANTTWRGLGEIEASGYELRPEFERFSADAWRADDGHGEKAGCLCGRVIMGRAEPRECPNFGTLCTPATPLGPCMVTAEGACGVWYANRCNG